MTASHHHLHRRRPWRRIIFWTFATLVVLSATFIGMSTWTIIKEARTALGLTRTNVPGIDNLLVVSNINEIPADSLLSPSYVHVCLRVAELADSLEASNVMKAQRLKLYAALFNQHALSRPAYIWARSELNAAIHTPHSRRDSLNAALVHIMQPRLEVLRRVYDQHLDTLLLGPIEKR